jgi:putative SOS response-associated peptidase YedK
MPVILPSETYSQWLDPSEQRPEDLQKFLKPYPAEEMKAFPVSRLVNSPEKDTPQCIQPVNA